MLHESGHGNLGAMFPVCPLCGCDINDGSMMPHIADHLKFLALKCLPVVVEGDRERDMEKDGSICTASSTGGSLSTMLAFCDAPDDLQDNNNGEDDAEHIDETDGDGDGDGERGGGSEHSSREEEWGMILARRET